MTLGTLRDQVIYPDSHKEQLDKGWTDASLEKILDEVNLHTLSMIADMSINILLNFWYAFLSDLCYAYCLDFSAFNRIIDDKRCTYNQEKYSSS